jgi:hypothetical protein
MRRRKLRLFLAGCAAALSVAALFSRTKKPREAREPRFAPNAADDLTFEQTAMLGRVREIWETQQA